MSRPTKRDESVINEAAQKLSTQLLRWAEAGESERDSYLSDAREVLKSPAVYNAYDMARQLETRHGYSPDFALVEICDNAYFLLSEAHTNAVRRWVEQLQIKSPFAIGQQVRIDNGRLKGEIVDIDEREGKCTVCCPSLGHVKEGMGTRGRVVTYEEISLEAVAA